MLVLRFLHQITDHSGPDQVTIELEGEGLRRTTTVPTRLEVAKVDRERIRWYLEDFPQYPWDPAPQIAMNVEERLVELGIDLFKELFPAHSEAREMWKLVRNDLSNVRVEVVTTVKAAPTTPWELLRDPETNIPVLLQTRAFVRTHPPSSTSIEVPQSSESRLRVLLVICRPDREYDVPFRSVAGQSRVSGLCGGVQVAEQDVWE
jgi:hypothetical protein